MDVKIAHIKKLSQMNLSSQNKRILVFSDPHQNIPYVEHLLNKEKYDVAVCLGDWFDSFNLNSERDLELTCNFLKKWLFKDNFYTCIGNHDIQYLFDNNSTICSGYSRDKDLFITDYLGSFLPPIRDKFLWYLWIDDFLCSHAGINSRSFPFNQEINKPAITTWLDEQIDQAVPKLINGSHHWFYGAGEGRGGRQKIGGITWQDFDTEFEPIDGLKQLVGHSSHNIILNHHTDGSLDLKTCDNLDIDCHLNEYLIISNGKLQIKKLKDL
jgi:hypothetical protein